MPNTKEPPLDEALDLARRHAMLGLERAPFDAILRTALVKVSLVEQALSGGRSLASVPRQPDIGLMAAKEFGNEEAAFATALSVIQAEVDAAHDRATAWTWLTGRRGR